MKVWVLNGCMMLAAVSLAGSARGDDLLTLYRQAAESSPVVEQARALVQVDKEGRAIARSALAPRLRAQGAVSRNRLDLEGFGPAPIDDEYTAASYSVTLTQPLFAAAAWSTLQASTAEARSAEEALLAAKQDLILQVATAYFEVLRAESFVQTTRTRKQLFSTMTDQAEQAHRAGTDDIIAVEEARAALDGAASDLLGASNTVRVARRNLERLAHQPVGVLADLGEMAPQGPTPDRVDEWVDVALKNQPLLHRARLRLEASDHLVSAAGRTRWPTVSLFVEHDRADGTFAPDINRRESLAGISALWPLFEGGKIGAARRQAEAAARASRYELVALEDEVRLDIQRAFLNLEDSVARLGAAHRALASATTALNATKKGHEVGSRSVVDVLDGARHHADAQSKYDQALYGHVLARLRLKAAAGVLMEKDVESVNGLLEVSSSDMDRLEP